MDDRTPEERLAAIEVLMTERKETGATWRKGVDKKLDKILKNSSGYITTNALEQAIKTHAGSCAARNPSNSPPKILSWAKMGWKELGVLGSSFGVIFILLYIVYRLLEMLNGMA